MVFVLLPADEFLVVEEEDDEVEKRNDVVLPAGFVKLHLVRASIQNIALKHVKFFFFFDMLRISFDELSDKSKIYEVYFELVGCFLVVDHDVFGLQIIERSI